MKIISALTLLALVGCSSSGPLQVGPNTYMIAKESASNFSGEVTKAEIVKEGNQHCASLGKEFQLINSTGKNYIPFARSASAEIKYTCIDKVQ